MRALGSFLVSLFLAAGIVAGPAIVAPEAEVAGVEVTGTAEAYGDPFIFSSYRCTNGGARYTSCTYFDVYVGANLNPAYYTTHKHRATPLVYPYGTVRHSGPGPYPAVPAPYYINA